MDRFCLYRTYANGAERRIPLRPSWWLQIARPLVQAACCAPSKAQGTRQRANFRAAVAAEDGLLSAALPDPPHLPGSWLRKPVAEETMEQNDLR